MKFSKININFFQFFVNKYYRFLSINNTSLCIFNTQFTYFVKFNLKLIIFETWNIIFYLIGKSVFLLIRFFNLDILKLLQILIWL